MAALGSRIFGSLVRARERAYASGRLGVARLGAPVASVGNLSTGGSGKTPTVIALGRALREQGIVFDVLTRGYRRRRRKLAVAQTGAEDPAEVGDEPLLIARALDVPVLVHPDRFRAGLEAERRFHPQLHLLDDGFQHRQLARAFDLVLLTPRDLEDQLLPAGRLREPLASLQRAQAVLWVAVNGEAPPDLNRWTAAPVFVGCKRVRPGQRLRAQRPFAFCGLARPESFWGSLEQAGISTAGWRAFRDHHRYTARDRAGLERRARAKGADGLVTTVKDAVKLADWRELEVLDIEMHIPQMAELVALIRWTCGV